MLSLSLHRRRTRREMEEAERKTNRDKQMVAEAGAMREQLKEAERRVAAEKRRVGELEQVLAKGKGDGTSKVGAVPMEQLRLGGKEA